MTKILELPDDVARQLETEAKAMKMAPETWALIKLQRHAIEETIASEISDDEWDKLSKGVIEDNRELLDRLAK